MGIWEVISEIPALGGALRLFISLTKTTTRAREILQRVGGSSPAFSEFGAPLRVIVRVGALLVPRLLSNVALTGLGRVPTGGPRVRINTARLLWRPRRLCFDSS